MKLTELELLDVVSEDGRRLGRLFDLRAHGRPTSAQRAKEARVDELIYGTLGLLERVGFRKAKGCALPWSDVVRIGASTITVRSGAKGRRL
jgi:sporulation protein YlmC with PRC-barrel domain